MEKQKKFFAQFRFDQSKSGLVGVEREQFVVERHSGCILPLAIRYLDLAKSRNGSLNSVGHFNLGYELSACQLESKIGPSKLEDLHVWLKECESALRDLDDELCLSRENWELAPEDMPLDVYPDPTGRYQIITKEMPEEVLSAACRVAATHIHIGMPDLATAIKVHNRAIGEVKRLTELGNSSGGKRMELYKVMAKRYRPEPIASPQAFYKQAVMHKFVNDPRQCWTMIRISIHGTVEFRMFGATDSIDRIVGWASECHKLCF